MPCSNVLVKMFLAQLASWIHSLMNSSIRGASWCIALTNYSKYLLFPRPNQMQQCICKFLLLSKTADAETGVVIVWQENPVKYIYILFIFVLRCQWVDGGLSATQGARLDTENAMRCKSLSSYISCNRHCGTFVESCRRRTSQQQGDAAIQ